MTDTRRKYTDEFKAEAVRLLVEEGYSLAEAARNLGINPQMLGRWKRALSEDDAQHRADADEKAELRKLREEVRRLRMEREILKKATVGMPPTSLRKNRAEASIHPAATEGLPSDLALQGDGREPEWFLPLYEDCTEAQI